MTRSGYPLPFSGSFRYWPGILLLSANPLTGRAKWAGSIAREELKAGKGILDKMKQTRLDTGGSMEQLVQQALSEQGINVASPEGREIASSILHHASLTMGTLNTIGASKARNWVRNRMARDIVETAEWIGLLVDESGYIWIPPNWRRPSDSNLNQFRLPRLARFLANGYANRTMRRRSTSIYQ